MGRRRRDTTCRRRRVGIGENHVVARQGSHRGDSGAHQAGSDDCYSGLVRHQTAPQREAEEPQLQRTLEAVRMRMFMMSSLLMSEIFTMPIASLPNPSRG
jgi:hypothetical protein